MTITKLHYLILNSHDITRDAVAGHWSYPSYVSCAVVDESYIEPTQWDNNSSDPNSKKVDDGTGIKDHLDSVPCTESEDSDED